MTAPHSFGWNPVSCCLWSRLRKPCVTPRSYSYTLVDYADFVVQFGLASDPAETKKWRKSLQDDHPEHPQSNLKGTITYAKTNSPNTRSTQVYVNTNNNGFLDDQGFTPFGKVTTGLHLLEQLQKICNLSQSKLTAQGNTYALKECPGVDLIISTTVKDGTSRPIAIDPKVQAKNNVDLHNIDLKDKLRDKKDPENSMHVTMSHGSAAKDPDMHATFSVMPAVVVGVVVEVAMLILILRYR